MTPDVEKNLSKVLNCTGKSSQKVYFAAHDLLQDLGKLGKRKAHRASALQALQKIAIEAYQPLRASAANQLADLLSADDTAHLPFLRQGLKNNDIEYGCVCGLLQVLGAVAYEEIVPLILDPKRDLNSRCSALEAICEHSGQPFAEDLPVFQDMKAKDLPVDQIQAWADAGFPAYVPVEIEVPVAALSKLGIELPDDYVSFLKQHRKSVTYEYDDCSWQLTMAAELLTKIDVDGKSVPSIQQLKRYAATLKRAMQADSTEDHKGKAYPLDRLAAGVVIGTDDSGDLLYLDPSDKHSVWIFHHDGGDVELATKTFKSWLRQAETDSD